VLPRAINRKNKAGKLCTVVTFEFGAWDLSYSNRSAPKHFHPTPMREYEENVRKAFGTSEVAAFRKYFSVAKVKAPKIFVITFAPAPVGCYDTHCPPLRWYSFQAVEALNNMARTAARKSGLGIIDVHSHRLQRAHVAAAAHPQRTYIPATRTDLLELRVVGLLALTRP